MTGPAGPTSSQLNKWWRFATVRSIARAYRWNRPSSRLAIFTLVFLTLVFLAMALLATCSPCISNHRTSQTERRTSAEPNAPNIHKLRRNMPLPDALTRSHSGAPFRAPCLGCATGALAHHERMSWTLLDPACARLPKLLSS